MNTEAEVLAELLKGFRLAPTAQQHLAFRGLARLLLTEKQRATYLIRGAAGTGKTTLLRALTAYLTRHELPFVLLAPTGRAAKVISRKVGEAASTIHRHIYAAETLTGGSVSFRRTRNEDRDGTLYIVDEASMIGEANAGDGPAMNLLQDLMAYVFPPRSTHKLLLMGDPAQLPPIGLTESPALSLRQLTTQYDLLAGQVELTEVKRQALESGILAAATRVRQEIDRVVKGDSAPAEPLQIAHAKDVTTLESAEEVVDRFTALYDRDNLEKVVVICYSNQMATQLNQAIRARLHSEPEQLNETDVVMVVKNHYRSASSDLPFLANGEVGVVNKVFVETLEERFGQQWCEVKLAFQDLRQRQVLISTKVPVSLLTSKRPALSYDENQKIWQERRTELEKKVSNPKKLQLRQDAYIGAMQLKYGYAITGHKSQGGQWENVLVVFEPYLNHNMQAENRLEFLRWCYTAMTRASGHLYLFNSPFGMR